MNIFLLIFSKRQVGKNIVIKVFSKLTKEEYLLDASIYGCEIKYAPVNTMVILICLFFPVKLKIFIKYL
jgi:hypothetical protein